MKRHWQPLLQLAGRACLGLVFLSSAAARVRDFHDRCGDLTLDGVPVPGWVLGCWIALAAIGGLAVALGWRTRTGLVLLAACTLLGVGMERRPSLASLPLSLSSAAANLALLAALASLVAAGPGPWSFDARHAARPNELGDSNVLG